MRRHQCEQVDTDPLVWTNQRFIRWARNIDLTEYAENLKGTIDFCAGSYVACSIIHWNESQMFEYRFRCPRCSRRAGTFLYWRHNGNSSGYTASETHDQTTPHRRIGITRRSSKVLSLLSSRGNIGQRSLIDIKRRSSFRNEIDNRLTRIHHRLLALVSVILSKGVF